MKNKAFNYIKNLFLSPNTIRYLIECRVLVTLLKPVITSADTLLDAGAGSGQMSLKLRRKLKFKKIIAIEPDKKNFDKLKRNLSNSNNFRLYNQSIEDVSIENEVADIVISTQVFEHIQDDFAAAKQISRLVKHNGYVLISTTHPPEMFPSDGHVREGYYVSDLTNLFSSLGFSYVNHDYFFFHKTINIYKKLRRLPLNGIFIPVIFCDREKKYTPNDKQKYAKYGIAILLKKDSVCN
jgi:2-polyprenyl-3-methyl-5-hydroxy-6-metoxy-1,4-benzoquinol methylase